MGCRLIRITSGTKGGKMKRYDIEDTGTPGKSYYEMIENDDGEWVKWEDVRELIKRSERAEQTKCSSICEHGNSSCLC